MLDIEALYAAYGDRVRSYLGRRLADRRTAEDLAQDVWVRAWRHRGRYVETGAPVEAWLLRIARNLLTDHARRASHPHAPHRLGLAEASLPHPKDEVATTDIRIDLAGALAALTAPQRAVVVGRFYEGRRHDQMGHVATLNGSKKLQDRALANLRKALEAA